ncbi:hypothetical protein HNR39_003296 [Glaciimonas immobilis]|uniref:Uncharacterized protein n=1 Tax=Glaciimonas immobilis TaxID=728004 RepID=A0A840RV04_9BURK|nr:hypothetical protein [Glaciimonas immobilis]
MAKRRDTLNGARWLLRSMNNAILIKLKLNHIDEESTQFVALLTFTSQTTTK